MKKPIALAVIAALSGGASAADGQFDWLSFSGFGTLAASSTDDKNVGHHFPFQKNYKADQWATDVDTRMGVQLDVNRGGTFSGVLQLTAMQRDKGEFRADVEWANVMWTINEAWRVRVGRMVTPVFMQSDSRFVGYAMIPVRYDQALTDIYALSRHDGAEAIFATGLGGGNLQLQGFAGTSKYRVPGIELEGELIAGGAATYSYGPFTVRGGYTGGKAKVIGAAADQFKTISAALGNPLLAPACPLCAGEQTKFNELTEGFDFSLFSVGGSYDSGNWYAQAEYTSATYTGTLSDTSGYLVLGAYRWGRFTPFISASGLSTSSNNEAVLTGVGPAAPLAAAVNGIYLSHLVDRTTFSVGLRWDFASNVALKIQADMVKHDHPTAPMGGSFPNLSPAAYDGKVNLYTAALDFIF